MRVLICPDSFTGTMTAAQAAQAISIGWQRYQPDVDFTLLPLSDGGPGFVSAMATALGGELIDAHVRGPLGDGVSAQWLLVGGIAFVESAQACGSQLLSDEQRSPAATSTYGVGELIAAAIDRGAQRIVIGLGGSATNDAGAGALAALGATAADEHGRDLTELLAAGGLGLRRIAQVDLSAALARVGDVVIEVATDVDNPLLGLRGATNTYAPQKGADQSLVMQLEGSVEAFAQAVGRRADGKNPAVALGAGAAGGLGFGLMAIGALRSAGIARIMTAADFDACLAQTDLVITGEGAFDWQSLRGKVVTGVAEAALAAGKPAIVLAGRVEIGRREWQNIGVSGAYAVTDVVDDIEAFAAPESSLARLAERVARTWAK